MKNVIIIGASGRIARRSRRLEKKALSGASVVEGDALKYDGLRDAIAGKDIVYINLAGDLEAMT